MSWVTLLIRHGWKHNARRRKLRKDQNQEAIPNYLANVATKNPVEKNPGTGS